MKKTILILTILIFSLSLFSCGVSNDNGDSNPVDPLVVRSEYVRDISKFKAVWEDDWTPPSWTQDFNEKFTELPLSSGRVMAFGHRGDIEHYPENSIEGIISAVKMGADGVEIDCFYSKDGVIVLNHSETLAETTDWSKKYGKTINGKTLPKSNKIKDWTYDELKELNLRFGEGEYSSSGSKVSEYKMATLEEALIVCKDRCFLSLDRLTAGGLQSPDWENVYKLVKKTGAYKSVLYLNMALTPNDANDLRNKVKTDTGIDTLTIFDRTGKHNCIINHDNPEFSLKTEKDYDGYYRELIKEGTFVVSNRLTHLIDWIDKNYKK